MLQLIVNILGTLTVGLCAFLLLRAYGRFVEGLSGRYLTAEELPDFVHSEAYEVFRSPHQRRAALLALAPAVLAEASEEFDVATIRRLATATGGGGSSRSGSSGSRPRRRRPC